MRKGLVLLAFLSIALPIAAFVPEALCQDALSEALSELLTNPKTLLIFLIQLGLGFGLGYFSLKALKYIVAIVAILALGILLNVWRFGGVEGLIERLGYAIDIVEITSMLRSLASLLGILTILPIGAGFLVGVIVAIRK